MSTSTTGFVTSGATDRTFAVPAISWASIFGGAVAAAAVSFILITLGAGIGFASVSPWHNNSSGTAFSITTAIWLIVMQWVSAGVGGYLAGRLRAKWAGVHNDEAFFRDTAHGFLAWAVATLLTAFVIASAASSIVGAGAKAMSTVASGAAMGASHAAATSAAQSDPNAYFVDRLFRSNHPATGNAADSHAEATRLLVNDLAKGDVSEEDKAYLTQIVATQTGLSQPEAAKRVDDTLAQIQAVKDNALQAVEVARKASEKIAFFTFFSLLIGAFIASVAGAIGGKRRDEY